MAGFSPMSTACTKVGSTFTRTGIYNLSLRSLSTLGCTSQLFRETNNANLHKCNQYACYDDRTKLQSFLLLADAKRHMATTTVNPQELDKFQILSGKWWNETGELRPLHAMNALRVPLIRKGLISLFTMSYEASKGSHPLEGLRILDIECGGGILTEPLARLGATVKGIDPVAENVKAAEMHLAKDSSIQDKVQYECQTVENLAQKEAGQYDAVVASEVIEHVDNLPIFLQSCVALLKEEGSLFITTLNKTWKSYMLGIVGAKFLGIAPSGTHTWKKFVPPKDLMFSLEKHGCQTALLHGMCYNPFINKWSWTSDTRVNYALQVFKRTEGSPKE